MKTEKPGKFKCDQCPFTSNYPQVVGSHRVRIHGADPTSPSAIRRRVSKVEISAPPPPDLNCPHCEFVAKNIGGLNNHTRAAHAIPSPTRQQRKENQLVKRTEKAAVIEAKASHPNGQDHTNANGIPDALIAVASGRFIELCRSMAFEYDLPPRMFAARVAAFVYGSQVR